jgi:nicotinamide-nucleotide adenylyltransferase
MRVLILGRFQPFHKGHLELIKQATKQNEVIVGIGSAQESHKLVNPFTAGEREEMIHESLAKEGIFNYYLAPIPDINRYAIWPSHVASFCPRFDRVLSNNPLTKILFEEAGYEVQSCPMYKREFYSGSEIRRRMLAGEEWKELVPQPVARIIKEMKGVERLKNINKKD